jgi:hypothetical protein
MVPFMALKKAISFTSQLSWSVLSIAPKKKTKKPIHKKNLTHTAHFDPNGGGNIAHIRTALPPKN